MGIRGCCGCAALAWFGGLGCSIVRRSWLGVVGSGVGLTRLSCVRWRCGASLFGEFVFVSLLGLFGDVRVGGLVLGSGSWCVVVRR